MRLESPSSPRTSRGVSPAVDYWIVRIAHRLRRDQHRTMEIVTAHVRVRDGRYAIDDEKAIGSAALGAF